MVGKWRRDQYLLSRCFGDMRWSVEFFFHVALQPNAGYDLLILEVFEITHTTRHSR
jgi:hypothetical protein